MSSNDENIAMLMSMGFDQDQSLAALTSCGSLERAIDFLLSGGGAAVGGGASSISGSGHNNNNVAAGQSGQSDDNVGAVHSELSQYSDALGRSACTSIALTMACNVLNATATDNRNPDDDDDDDIIDSAFLSNSIREGIQMYSDIKSKSSGGAEHSSVEELLNACNSNNGNNGAGSGSGNVNSTSVKIASSMKQFDHSPRQGILSNSPDNPMGLETILSQCREDAANRQSHIAVVITKPPETVLVILPPPIEIGHYHSSSSQTSSYILLDSHPRPQQLSPHRPSGSYALFHPSLASLVASVKQIFPVTDLGSDVPEMMAMMYNTFDVYPFQYKG